MSNSKLVSYTKISPNKNPRKNSTYNPTGKITKITIHHMAGNLSVESCGNVFQTREASANYGIDSNGRVGMYVEEKDRSWASSSRENDYKAVTIEVANDGGADTDWHVSDKALAKLIDLCVDICQRNGIDKLTYTGDSKGNLTRHNMFAATACPGPYLQGKFPYIAEEVNKRLGADKPLYRVRKSWKDASSQLGAFEELDNAKAMADKNKGYAVFDESGKQVYPAGTATEKLYRVRKSWSDEASQKGAFKDLANAKAMADDTGYTVYDWNGKAVYTPKKTYSYKKGDYVVTCSKLNVRTGAGKKYRVKSTSELSASARKQGGYVKGVVFTALEVKNLPGESWARTPSGWVCLQNSDGTYVKRK